MKKKYFNLIQFTKPNKNLIINNFYKKFYNIKKQKIKTFISQPLYNSDLISVKDYIRVVNNILMEENINQIKFHPRDDGLIKKGILNKNKNIKIVSNISNSIPCSFFSSISFHYALAGYDSYIYFKKYKLNYISPEYFYRMDNHVKENFYLKKWLYLQKKFKNKCLNFYL